MEIESGQYLFTRKIETMDNNIPTQKQYIEMAWCLGIAIFLIICMFVYVVSLHLIIEKLNHNHNEKTDQSSPDALFKSNPYDFRSVDTITMQTEGGDYETK